MRLPLVLSALALLVAFAVPVGAKVANVTNPMGTDLDGGGHSIANVTSVHSTLGQVDVAMQLGSNVTPTVRGTLTMADGTTGEGVEIVAGWEDPSAEAFHLPPGTLYLRHTPDNHGEAWIQTCPTAAPCWTKLTG